MGCPPILLRRRGARALSVRPPAILHALAAYGGQLWRAALSQPSPTALPQAAAGLLGRPEAGLGHSGPAQRAGNHLSPVAEVGLLRPPMPPQGGCPRPSLASALSHWRGLPGTCTRTFRVTWTRPGYCLTTSTRDDIDGWKDCTTIDGGQEAALSKLSRCRDVVEDETANRTICNVCCCF